MDPRHQLSVFFVDTLGLVPSHTVVQRLSWHMTLDQEFTGWLLWQSRLHKQRSRIVKTYPFTLAYLDEAVKNLLVLDLHFCLIFMFIKEVGPCATCLKLMKGLELFNVSVIQR